MKYTCEVIINKPVEKVIELFDNPDNMKLWMEGLQHFEHISGTPGEAGAKSRLDFKMGKREITMTETITIHNLPEEFTATYEAKGVYNVVRNSLISISENSTKYTSENYFKFKGIMKLFGLLMPGAFKKQSMKYLIDFKNFAEKQVS